MKVAQKSIADENDGKESEWLSLIAGHAQRPLRAISTLELDMPREIRGHKDDILCVVQCPPSLLATSSYDGEIIIWNMISGHMYCKLNTPVLTHPSEDPEDRSVSHLTFLKTRAAKFESKAASLISNGQHIISYCLVKMNGLLMSTMYLYSFQSRGKSQISSMVVTTGDTCAYVADKLGYVYIYDIRDYALEGPEQEPPKNVKFWRAHVNALTSLELIEKEKALLSSSVDCTVRLWSMDGEYIGTFGQSELWDVFTSASWKHPMVPYEILMDPQSMPVHQTLAEDVSSLQIDHMEDDKGIQEKSSAKVGSNKIICVKYFSNLKVLYNYLFTYLEAIRVK
uniref:WD repeat domain 49 n=1 Tax=Vombatus ursinus TaxID=29139 RepID=A0A4X2LMN7_VOMUR